MAMALMAVVRARAVEVRMAVVRARVVVVRAIEARGAVMAVVVTEVVTVEAKVEARVVAVRAKVEARVAERAEARVAERAGTGAAVGSAVELGGGATGSVEVVRAATPQLRRPSWLERPLPGRTLRCEELTTCTPAGLGEWRRRRLRRSVLSVGRGCMRIGRWLVQVGGGLVECPRWRRWRQRRRSGQ